MLKDGAVRIQGDKIYGDTDHCPLNDLLESARALLEISKQFPGALFPGSVKNGISKDFDRGCYVWNTSRPILEYPQPGYVLTHIKSPLIADEYGFNLIGYIVNGQVSEYPGINIEKVAIAP